VLSVLNPSDDIPHLFLRAVSYLRVSTPRQASNGFDEEGHSIPAQRDANRRRAHELGALVAAEFVDRGRSGRSTARPELQRMLDYIRSHEVDYVIVHKVDRLARNRGDDAHLTDEIHAAGAKLVSTTEAINASPSGRLLHGIMASIAEFYSQNLATEVMKGMRQKASNGGTPGRAPLGYLNERRFDDDGREIRTIVIDPDRGPHITWAFRAYASGEWSITRLAAVLNDRGMTTKPGPNTQAQPLTARSVHHLLRNAYYQGTVTFNGVEHPGRHEPLIDPVTWAAVQDMLAAHRNGERSRVHDHYLKGTVFCFECGRRLIVQSTQTKSGRVYDYFVCHRRRDSTCTQRKALPIAIVEQRVEDLYRSIQLSPQQRKRVEQVALASLRRRQTINVERLDSLAEQATAVETNRTKLLNAYYAEALPRDLFLAEQRRLTAERARLDRERRRTETDRASLEAQVRDALDLLEDAHATYASASRRCGSS